MPQAGGLSADMSAQQCRYYLHSQSQHWGQYQRSQHLRLFCEYYISYQAANTACLPTSDTIKG